ncbi:uncharacterized protein LOC129717837 isoform X2 [Wyeomyia smithii]|uniref:uncharacterized protein LOC129717837 isoform X2 n=1 Tax=Wyeomyia smithii TaxID=174621 RepID=UPI002467E894|nr:uncharacterized protein LOC129717837 isoform X2 [Wyeomyia smithii]
MTLAKGTSFVFLLTVFMFLILHGIIAAPISKETESDVDMDSHKEDVGNESMDEEVLELEHLKHETTAGPSANTKEEILPQLEKQLEEEAKASATILSSNEEGLESEDIDDDIDSDGDSNNNNVDYAEKIAKASENMLLKTLAEYHHKQQQQQHIEDHHFISHPHNAGERKNPDSIKDSSLLMKLLPGTTSLNNGSQHSLDQTTPTVSDPSIILQTEQISKSYHEMNSLTSNGQRRSNAEILLRHSGGQYSAFDMAQYVFWTGDEAGVARAVEELIQKGLMTRENAIKFLRDIRLGIDYLQNTYSSSSLKSDSHLHSERDSSTAMTAATEAPTTTIATHTEGVVDYSLLEQPATLSPEIAKVIERLPSLLKLNGLNEEAEATQDYDDVVGRLRLADFLYAEYSLEEVIYQLSKVMFTQSLTRGSEPAQNALEKLTAFLESEGSHGRISPSLQKKILDVLLAALADTLADNPELMKAVRAALGNHMEKPTK